MRFVAGLVFVFVLLSGIDGWSHQPTWSELAGSDSEKTKQPEPLPDRAAVEAVLAKTEAKLNQFESGELSSSNESSHIRTIYQRLVSLYHRQLKAMSRRDRLLLQLEDAERQLETVRMGVTAEQESAANFLLLDELVDQLAQEKRLLKLGDDFLKSMKSRIAASRTEQETLERKRRLVKDQGGSNAEALRMLDYEIQAAEANVNVYRLEVAVQELEQELSNAQIATLEIRIDRLQLTVRFREEDLQQIYATIEAKVNTLSARVDRRQERLSAVDRQLAAINDNRDDVVSNQQQEAQVAMLSATRRTLLGELELFARQRERALAEKTIWERRYKLSSRDVPSDEQRLWREEANDVLNGSEDAYHQAKLSELRGELQSVNRQLEGISRPSAERSGILEEHSRQILALIGAYQVDLADLASHQQLWHKLRQDLNQRSVGTSVGTGLENIWAAILEVWNFEIANYDDRPITVKKIFLGLLLLIVGIWFSRRASKTVATRIVGRFSLNRSSQAAMQTVIFYLLVVIFSIFVLQLVNVPITIFTLLGGAIAIGVGFGSQNVMNNFISGLILLVERPIKIGDLIQVNDLYGTVRAIGGRSTRIQMASNVDIIVPNSSFLEQNVVNWTLSDNLIRATVTVGVAYGSPTRLVRDILVKVCEEHEKVINDPEPLVLFTEFGDNALGFEVYFWIQIHSQMERRTIESDLRFRIDDLCRENDVTIAFPQRDVHLDTLKPLEVRMIGQGESKD